MTTDLVDKAGAEFSPCRTWRYALWRNWDWQSHGNVVMFIGLNPSTADESKNDPTIRRCINFAKAWGFGGIIMMNLFAFRTPYPAQLWTASVDPVGPGNDEAFGYQASRCGMIVAAWGAAKHRIVAPRAAAIAGIVCGKPLFSLGQTAEGHPRHPLYVRGDTFPTPFVATLLNPS